MKILYVLSDSLMGGATHSVLTLINEMKKSGNDVIVVSPNMCGYLKDRLKELNIKWKVIQFGFFSYPSFRNIFKLPFRIAKIILREYKAARIISDIITKENIDIVHTNVGPVVCGYLACRKTRTPHVWHIREYGDKDFNIRMIPSRHMFMKQLQNSNVITITKDLLLYNRLETSKKARVIYNGVRKKSDIRKEMPKKKFFLCASRVSPEKGFDQVIRVFAKFHKINPEFKLVIIGLGNIEYVNSLLQMAKDMKVDQVISYEGYKENVSDYMAKSMALVVASPNEGFGRMTAESAFAGSLVIGKDTAGTKEILDIIGGYRFISDDDLLYAMTEVVKLSDEDYIEKAKYAQKNAIIYFSEEQYVRDVLKFYYSILSQKTC